MRVITGQGGRVAGIESNGEIVVENASADWMRECGVPVSQVTAPAPVPQKRDEVGRWM